MSGLVERIDGRLDGRPETPQDLARVPLFQEGEEAVDPVHLLPDGPVRPLAGAGEVAVDLPRGEIGTARCRKSRTPR
jgi:hypothetical protein